MKFRADLSLTFFMDVGHRLTADLESASMKFQIRAGFPEFEFILTELIRQNDPEVISKAISDAYSHDKMNAAGFVEIADDRLHSFQPFRTY